MRGITSTKPARTHAARANIIPDEAPRNSLG